MQHKRLISRIAAILLAAGMTLSGLPVYANPVVMPDGGVFDSEFYADTYPDVTTALGTDAEALYQHYETFGLTEGRRPYASKWNTVAGTKAMVNSHIENGVNGFDNCPAETLASVNEIYMSKRLTEPLVTATLLDVAEELGTEFDGLQYAVKTASSVADKLARKQESAAQKGTTFSAEQTVSEMGDILRYTEIAEHDEIFPVARQTIALLEAEGYVLSEVKNYFLTPFATTKYRGLHLSFITPYGDEMELQVHSRTSFDAKQAAHEIYEKARAVSTPAEEKPGLYEEAARIHGSFPNPAEYTSIQNYAMAADAKAEIIAERKQNTEVSYSDKDGEIHYSIYENGTLVLSGCERTLEDGTVHCYRQVPGELPVWAVISDQGTLIGAQLVADTK